MAVTSARGQSLDERFVAGLRERHLLTLAEKYCRDRLARTASPSPAVPGGSDRVVALPGGRGPGIAGRGARRALAAAARCSRSIQQAISHRRPACTGSRQRGLVELAWGELLRKRPKPRGTRNNSPRPAITCARRSKSCARRRQIERDAERRLRPGQKLADGDLASGQFAITGEERRVSIGPAMCRQGESYPDEAPIGSIRSARR